MGFWTCSAIGLGVVCRVGCLRFAVRLFGAEGFGSSFDGVYLLGKPDSVGATNVAPPMHSVLSNVDGVGGGALSLLG